jgi:diadenosine tetraphosphate (Ap4A) HIT family hydrolase
MSPLLASHAFPAKPTSLVQFSRQSERGLWIPTRDIYTVRRRVSLPLALSPAAIDMACRILRAPPDEVRSQELVEIANVLLQHRATFGVLRSRRVAPPNGPPAADLIDQERLQNGCEWCDGSVRGVVADAFGKVVSEDGRFIAQANLSRQASANGLITGDAQAHNFLRLSRADFLAMWSMVDPYIAEVKKADPSLRYFFIGWNGGPKSAGSVSHCHLNVLAWQHAHCAFAEQVLARCPWNYWTRVLDIHREIGLTFRHGPVTGFASLCPVKEREVLWYAPDLMTGADTLHRVLETLIEHGTNNFSVAAILAPDAALDARFGGWPRVLWRIVDRGDMRARHSDFGTVEVLGGTTIFSSDPWETAGWLRAGIGFDD